jgi:lyso-ornithine lipid O-acyltransferase
MRHHFKPLRIGWRFLLLIIHIFTGLFLAIPFLKNKIHPGTFAATLTLWWHARICRIFGVQRKVYGEINQTPTLFVVNHISWFDIPALGSTLPVHFLSKDEVNSWPLIGWLATKTGTLYIKRGCRESAQQSMNDIREALENNGHVILFPEGTTSDGTSLKRFHSRLFQAAIDANAQIQPVAIRYPHPDGVHPKAPFIGDTQFLESTLDMMSEANMDVTLHFLKPMNACDFSRDELAQASKKQILEIIQS